MSKEELQDIRKSIIKEYAKGDVCISDMLAAKEVPSGMSLEQAFGLYVSLIRTIEGDEFLRCNFDEEWIEYVHDGFTYNSYPLKITETDRDGIIHLIDLAEYTDDDDDDDNE